MWDFWGQPARGGGILTKVVSTAEHVVLDLDFYVIIIFFFSLHMETEMASVCNEILYKSHYGQKN